MKRVEVCNNPKNSFDRFFVNIDSKDVLLIKHNNIYTCYTRYEFEKILNEKPPFVIENDVRKTYEYDISSGRVETKYETFVGDTKKAIEDQKDPLRTNWVYLTPFGMYIDNSLYIEYMKGYTLFTVIVPPRTVFVYKNKGGSGDVHELQISLYKVVGEPRNTTYLGGERIEQKRETSESNSDMYIPENDDLFENQNEMIEYLNSNPEKKQEIINRRQQQKLRENMEALLKANTEMADKQKKRQLKDEENERMMKFRVEIEGDSVVLTNVSVDNISEITLPRDKTSLVIKNSSLPRFKDIPRQFTKLKIENCEELKVLTESVTQHLTTLEIVDCKNLTKIEYLEGIKVLACNYVGLLDLTYLPNSLRILYLKNVDAKLPTVFPRFITTLNLNRCRELKEFKSLPGDLQTLNCTDCSYLTRFPDTLPTRLQNLILDGCISLKELPDHLPNSIKNLSLYGCVNIKAIQAFPDDLETVTLDDCTKLEYIPDCWYNHALKNLFCRNCTSLKQIPILPRNLKILVCDDCVNIVKFDRLPSKLEVLSCNNCISLEFIPDLPNTLRELFCNNCKKIQYIPKLPAQIQNISCNNCSNLRVIIDGIPSNVQYSLMNCNNLQFHT